MKYIGMHYLEKIQILGGWRAQFFIYTC
jgi:hypothetical protein